MTGRPRVVVLRGRQVSAWELGSWRPLLGEFDVVVPVPSNNLVPVPDLGLPTVPVTTLSSRVGPLATRVLGERHLDLRPVLDGADVLHAAEIGSWFAVEAARASRRTGAPLVVTVWETLPFLRAYRNVRTRRFVPLVLGEADLLLAATGRARAALLLEGADPGRVLVSPPGIDTDAFAVARTPTVGDDHVVLSVGRLVWEKGHQDVLRAVAALARPGLRVVLAGTGPERRRLLRYAGELGVDVELAGGLAYAEVPTLFARASCLVLASLPTPTWEEQFGMVLAEASAAHLPVLAAASGAIPEVLAGHGRLFAPGDWRGLAELLEAEVLARPPGHRVAPPPGLLERWSAAAAAERLRTAYRRVLE